MLISLTFAALGLLVAASAAPLEPRQAGTYWTDSGVSGILSTCSTPGTIAITFDDGPGAYTPTLLDHLAAQGVKATFFAVGTMVSDSPSILARAFSEGHDIASHTNTHADLTTLSDAGILAELQAAENAINSAAGVRPAMVRPPYGNIDQRSAAAVRSFGMDIVTWNFDSQDWTFSAASQVQDSVRSLPAASSAPGTIALFHDIHQSTVDAFNPSLSDNVIAILRGKGYSFVTLSQCLGKGVYKGASPTTPTSSTTSTSSTSTSPTNTGGSTPTSNTSTSSGSSGPTNTSAPSGSTAGCGEGVYWATGKLVNGVCVCTVGWMGSNCQTPNPNWAVGK